VEKCPDIAVIIPVFRDTPECCTLINHIRSWTKQPTEIIVVSGEQDTKLHNFCLDNHCTYFLSHTCRGAQLHMGARLATASVLWFLHADSAPISSSISDIGIACAEGCDSGHFRFAFTGAPSWGKTLIEGLVRLRLQSGGIPYGDQGLFIRRQSYFECGGFCHQPLFEEVTLVKKLRARSQFRALDTPIGVSPRRWEHNGWIKQSLINRSLAIRYILGTPAEQLALSYDQIQETSRLNNNQKTDV
jgi:rSAM/selenodomain-associated transferase 2